VGFHIIPDDDVYDSEAGRKKQGEPSEDTSKSIEASTPETYPEASYYEARKLELSSLSSFLAL
jgi:hypothetical protein